jgi:cellobiose transport system permease protein
VKSWLYRADVKASPYLYISPFFLIFATLGAFPLLFTAWVSLHDWSLLADDHPFIGLQNYRELLADSFFWNALGNTASIWVLSTVPQLIFALVLAHILNNRLRGQTLWRTGLLLPNITSVVAVTIIFGQLFGRDFGLINYVLGLFNLGQVDWQAGTATSHFAISVMVIWRWTGYNALIYLAAMQAVPDSLHEAATIDGATSLQRLRRITIPSIRPTIIFTVIVSTIGGMQLFAEPLLFGGGSLTGGSDRQFQTLALYLFEVGFGRFDFGYASATAWLMFLVIVLAAAFNFLLIRRIRRS